MRLSVVFLLIIAVMALPAGAHAFGVLKYTWDAIANQFGLDRGPIPKVMPKDDPFQYDKYRSQMPKHGYFPAFHLQAEGF